MGNQTSFKKNDPRLLGNTVCVGRVPWNKGKKGVMKVTPKMLAVLKAGRFQGKHTEETKKKISITKKGSVSPMKGRQHTLVARKKISMAQQQGKWSGFISPLSRIERKRFRDTVQKLVFERDGYACIDCGSKKDLQVDHIQPWAEYVELRFDINNCRTLCMRCHYLRTFGKLMPKHIKTWGRNFVKGGRLL